MPVTVGLIVDALIALGGEAHYNDIADYIVATSPPPFPANPAASVRARLQERCSDYEAYEGQQDLFESERKSGVWRFRSWTPSPPVTAMPVHEDGAGYKAQEGALVLKLHYTRERDPKLVSKFKAGLNDPNCEACGFNFKEAYGDLGAGYIEAHHKRLVASLTEGSTTRLSDLAALCPNCHRIIHKNYPMSVEELKQILHAPNGYAGYIADAKTTRTTWKQAVLNAIERVTSGKPNHEFSRQQLINTELVTIIAEVAAKGESPAQTMSRVLQELRSTGAIDFVDGKGCYRTK
ncbi:MAG: HNH endonuclease [Sphingomonadaceae bacterium]|nr:HNH endonuclease [Sphingomonadaceae bacterium]